MKQSRSLKKIIQKELLKELINNSVSKKLQPTLKEFFPGHLLDPKKKPGDVWQLPISKRWAARGPKGWRMTYEDSAAGKAEAVQWAETGTDSQGSEDVFADSPITEDAADDIKRTFDDEQVPDFVSDLGSIIKDSKVQAVLKAGQKDGDPNDDKLPYTIEKAIPVKNLIPTQSEIGFDQSIETLLTDQWGSVKSILDGNANVGGPIVTYNGQYIIDGHHRWSQVYAANPDAKMEALNIKAKPGLDHKGILKAVHAAVAAELDQVPSSNPEGINIMKGVSSDKIRSSVDSNLTPEAEKVWSAKKPEFGSGEEFKKNITNHLLKTLQGIIKKGSASGAPPRKYMPQTDALNTKPQDKLDTLAKGVVNIRPPYQTVESKQLTNERVNDFFYMDLKKYMWKNRGLHNNKIKGMSDEDRYAYLETLYKRFSKKWADKDIGPELNARLVKDKVIKESVNELRWSDPVIQRMVQTIKKKLRIPNVVMPDEEILKYVDKVIKDNFKRAGGKLGGIGVDTTKDRIYLNILFPKGREESFWIDVPKELRESINEDYYGDRIKKFTSRFKRFKLPPGYTIWLDSAYGGPSKIEVLRKDNHNEGVIITDPDWTPIALHTTTTGNQIMKKSGYRDLDKAMFDAVKYLDTVKESVNESINEAPIDGYRQALAMAIQRLVKLGLTVGQVNDQIREAIDQSNISDIFKQNLKFVMKRTPINEATISGDKYFNKKIGISIIKDIIKNGGKVTYKGKEVHSIQPSYGYAHIWLKGFKDAWKPDFKIKLKGGITLNDLKDFTISESINEGKYDHLTGKGFDIKGKKYYIYRIEDDRFVHVKDDHQNTTMFRLNWLIKNVPGFNLDKPQKARPPAWNKGQKTLSKREYEKILKNAMSDAAGLGDEEFTHDMASSMIHDPELKDRLKKEYPSVRREEDLIQRLQWDLEMYA